MSKNFEVLLRTEREADLFQTSSVAEEAAPAASPEFRFAGYAPVQIDPMVREEETRLVQRVFLLANSAAPQVVVFCGVEPGSGTTGICARAGENLAAQTGLPVCLVDGNLHSPSLHKYFGLANHHGLTNAVLDSAPIGNFISRLPAPNLSLLSVGSKNTEAAGLWTSDRLRARLAELRKEFSHILIDAPPVNHHVDGMLLGKIADGVILIVESNSTRRDIARKAKESLAAANVKVLGAVLNNRTFPIPESIYKRL
jgi:succinoglycan biosynthesis transport protein ExoP